MKVSEQSEKAGLKLNIQKTKIMVSGPITALTKIKSQKKPADSMLTLVVVISGNLRKHRGLMFFLYWFCKYSLCYKEHVLYF